MQGRWLHKPILHGQNSKSRRLGDWLEFLYDLVFVASFIQLGNGLSRDLSLQGLLGFVVVFTALWFSWAGFTFFMNRFRVDDFPHRILIFLKILAVAGMASFASHVLSSGPGARAFAVSYAVSQACVALLYLRSWAQSRHGRAFSRYWFFVFSFGAAIWAISAFFEPPITYGLWLLAIAGFMIAPFLSQSKTAANEAPYDHPHLSRRFGVFSVIVLGEAFAQVIASLASSHDSIGLFPRAAVALTIVFGVWWIYFDDIVSAKLKVSRFAMPLWMYGHLPMHAAIVILGVGIQRSLIFEAPSGSENLAFRGLLCFSLAIVFISVAVLDTVTEHQNVEINERVRISTRILSAVLLLILGPASQGMANSAFVGLIAIIAGAQVFFDMLMSSPDLIDETEAARPTAELARERLESGGKSPGARPPSIARAIRRNTPNEFRRDLYFYFIQGSWFSFLVAVGLTFVLVNLLFAGLYMLAPGSIANSRPESFADAFYFSVQTLATIGYGNLHPQTDYANIVVMFEAAIGLTGVALTTGLMFAKVSRPKAGIIFSRKIIITRYNGRQHLMFRTGNTRGNEVVSAEMTVSLLKDEISPEGQHIRRMVDLKLARQKSPFFSLTWLLMHEIDETSPFHGITSMDELEKRILSLMCVFTGHDSTYGQTIFARHQYFPSDILIGGNFVDVISQLPDGRLMVDYSKFHDVESAAL